MRRAPRDLPRALRTGDRDCMMLLSKRTVAPMPWCAGAARAAIPVHRMPTTALLT